MLGVEITCFKPQETYMQYFILYIFVECKLT